jgi:hypothetical protein
MLRNRVLELLKALTAHVYRHQHKIQQSIKGQTLIMLCVVWHLDRDSLC